MHILIADPQPLAALGYQQIVRACLPDSTVQILTGTYTPDAVVRAANRGNVALCLIRLTGRLRSGAPDAVRLMGRIGQCTPPPHLIVVMENSLARPAWRERIHQAGAATVLDTRASVADIAAAIEAVGSAR